MYVIFYNANLCGNKIKFMLATCYYTKKRNRETNIYMIRDTVT